MVYRRHLEDLSTDELYDELMELFINFKRFMPTNKEQLVTEGKRNYKAYGGMAHELIKILHLMEQKHAFEDYHQTGYRLNELAVSDERIIGREIPIILSGFNNDEVIKAKVDTGATMCSIDAQDIDIKKGHGVVSFTYGKHRVTMPVLDNQAVSSADGGTVFRPVVEFNVILPSSKADQKERLLKKIAFNLNDRSDMPDKVLLGMNFINAGDFVVVANNEEVGGMSGRDSMKNESYSYRQDRIRSVYKVLSESDITFEELMQYIRKNMYESF